MFWIEVRYKLSAPLKRHCLIFFALDHAHCHQPTWVRLSGNCMQPLNSALWPRVLFTRVYMYMYKGGHYLGADTLNHPWLLIPPECVQNVEYFTCTVAAKNGDIFVHSTPSRRHHVVNCYPFCFCSIYMIVHTIGNNGHGLLTCKNGKPAHLLDD